MIARDIAPSSNKLPSNPRDSRCSRLAEGGLLSVQPTTSTPHLTWTLRLIPPSLHAPQTSFRFLLSPFVEQKMKRCLIPLSAFSLPFFEERGPDLLCRKDLVLKAFFQTDYRGIETILEEWSDLRVVLELSEVPHFTTFQKAERRILDKASSRKLLQETIKSALTRGQMERIVELAAIDGSGFESHHVSHYFVRRRASHNNNLF